MDDVFTITKPTTAAIPILLSSPHSGSHIPQDIATTMTDAGRSSQDTDLFVDELYGFGPSIGCTLIAAKNSRYVIDLNRDPGGAALYNDGRHITALVPVTTFDEEPIYEQQEPDQTEIARRVATYRDPYFSGLSEHLNALQEHATNGQALIWDCHSIKRHVRSISAKPFPDLILGNADGTTCDPALLDRAREQLAAAGFEVSVNHPFKGGFITRHFGQPDNGRHAIQLEMCQDIYMNEADRTRNLVKEKLVGEALAKTLQAVAEVLRG